MPKTRDVTGQKFGKLTALNFVKKTKSGCYVWLFSCDCGSKKTINRHTVINGNVKSCGCLKSSIKYNIEGKKFGNLTAIKFVEKIATRHIWLFKCGCGNEKEINRANVISGNTVSCGCYIKKITSKRNCKDLIGKRFGGAVVTAKHSQDKYRNWLWKCLCDCGKEFFASTVSLNGGFNRSCGCARKGKNSRLWAGGKHTTKSGYVYIHRPNHPFATKRGYVLEHRLIIEKKLGRYLLRNENVHHINGNKSDNRVKNLELWVKAQPSGQRAKDLVSFAKEILKTYGDLFPEEKTQQSANLLAPC